MPTCRLETSTVTNSVFGFKTITSWPKTLNTETLSIFDKDWILIGNCFWFLISLTGFASVISGLKNFFPSLSLKHPHPQTSPFTDNTIVWPSPHDTPMTVSFSNAPLTNNGTLSSPIYRKNG